MRAELRDGAILIRPYCAADVDLVYAAARESVKELSRWLPWCHEQYAIEETREFILARDDAWKNNIDYGFGVFDATTGQFLGGVGLSQVNRIHQIANLGYWVRTSATGRGTATRAARLAAQFGFEQAGLGRIEILAAVANTASRRVAEKAGATREGVLRRRLLTHGEIHDAVMFSLIPEDLAVPVP